MGEGLRLNKKMFPFIQRSLTFLAGSKKCAQGRGDFHQPRDVPSTYRGTTRVMSTQ